MARYSLKLTTAARSDVKKILRHSVENHGGKAAQAYEALIAAAFRQLQEDPYRASSKDRDDIAAGMRSYHIALAKAESSVKNPRHIIFYFLPQEGRLVVSRILHDVRDHTRSMEEMRRHVMEQAAAPQKTPPGKGKGRKK